MRSPGAIPRRARADGPRGRADVGEAPVGVEVKGQHHVAESADQRPEAGGVLARAADLGRELTDGPDQDDDADEAADRGGDQQGERAALDR